MSVCLVGGCDKDFTQTQRMRTIAHTIGAEQLVQLTSIAAVLRLLW